MIRAWMYGLVTPPPNLFFQIVDVLHSADPDLPGLRDDAPPDESPLP